MREEGHQAGNGAANKSRAVAGSGSTSMGVAEKNGFKKTRMVCLT